MTGGSSVIPTAQLAAFEKQLRSIPLTIVATLTDLPNATMNQGRQFIVRNVGGGTKGVVVALDGVWINYAGVTVA